MLEFLSLRCSLFRDRGGRRLMASAGAEKGGWLLHQESVGKRTDRSYFKRPGSQICKVVARKNAIGA